MGQFLDYLSSVFSINKVEQNSTSSNKSNHVTFADNSFAQVFGSSNKSDSLTDLLTKSNRNTIYLYQAICALSCLIHLFVVTLPKVRLESFDLTQPDGWQLVSLSLIPMIIYTASVGAMYVVSRPLSEGVKLTAKNSTGLDLNNNDFIYSLKIVILLMAICQVFSIFFDQFMWSPVMIVPLWCYQLTSRIARSEYQRYTPNPKKTWVNLNISRSPKSPTPAKKDSPVKQTPSKQQKQDPDNGVKATPRTRTRRAVKNMINNVSDKYHAFEQNVAQQLSQKVFNPMSPNKLKMIE